MPQHPCATSTCCAGKLDLLQKARVITAIKTPYTRNGKFDLVAFDQMVEYQIQCGVDGLIIGGTTGEGQLMSWDEHVMLIAHTARVFGDNILVIGNTGGPSYNLTPPILDLLLAK